jgi:phage terminase small subunit
MVADGGATRIRTRPDLPPDEARLFNELVASAAPGHFRQSDAVLLQQYCGACCLAMRAGKILRQQGVIGPDGSENPWHGVQMRAVKTMTTLARALRLSPQSRPPHIASRATPRRPSAYELMALEQGDPEQEDGQEIG